MGENSAIEWTDHTFNPWVGCTKVSEGCKNCYAETLMDDRFGRVKWGPAGTRQRTSASNWAKPKAWNRKAQKEGRRYRVFCASLADVFEDRAELAPWRYDLFRLIEETPRLDWLLLTKRPENVSDMIEEGTGFSDAEMWLSVNKHVWIGTSVENQDAANKRIPELVRVPAAHRFLSMEPLLGSVDLTNIRLENGAYWDALSALGPGESLNAWAIEWVIVGGESGANARPMHPYWARSIRDQCVKYNVPFHFKQWGEWALKSAELHGAGAKFDSFGVLDPDGTWMEGVTGWNGRPIDPDTDEAYMLKVGKKVAGRLLDGIEWNGSPWA